MSSRRHSRLSCTCHSGYPISLLATSATIFCDQKSIKFKVRLCSVCSIRQFRSYVMGVRKVKSYLICSFNFQSNLSLLCNFLVLLFPIALCSEMTRNVHTNALSIRSCLSSRPPLQSALCRRVDTRASDLDKSRREILCGGGESNRWICKERLYLLLAH